MSTQGKHAKVLHLRLPLDIFPNEKIGKLAIERLLQTHKL